MKTKITTLFILLIMATCVYAQNDAYHDALLVQLQTDYGLAGGDWILTPDEVTNATNAISYGNQVVTQVPVSGQVFTQALNLDIGGMGTNPWDAGYYNESINTVQQGDRVLTVVWLRTASTALAAPGKINMFVERPVTYDKEFIITTNPTAQWQQYLIPFEASGDFMPAEMRIGFHLAFQEQVIEFGGLALINYGTSVVFEDLPQELHNDYYPGIEPNAPWRVAAADRIEQNRKADLQLQVLDATGAPIPNASVEIEMVRHLYAFGTAVDTRKLANNSGFDQTYQDNLLDLDGEGHGFNWVVTENALKWDAWEEGWAGTQAETVNAIQWLADNKIKVRGHALVWPGWDLMPDDMQTNAGDPAYLTNRINEHLNEILNTPGIKDNVREWDVLNEIVHVTDLENALQGTTGYPTGREVYPEIFNTTLQQDPDLITYLNDYSILSDGSVNGGGYTGFKTMAQEIIDAGATIDGVGLQAHMGSALISPDSLYAILEDCYQTFGTTIKVTEYDQSDLLEDPMAAQYTGDFVTMIFSHPATSGFLMWGFWDGAHWLNNAPLYDDDWTPKATHTTFTDLLFNQWWTNETMTTDVNGNLTIRGFKGDYKIKTTLDGTTITADLELHNNVDTTLQLLPTAIISVLGPEDVELFPNPVSDILSLKMPYQDKWLASITDEAGRVVYTHKFNSMTQFFDVSKYPAGIYYLNLRNEEGVEVTKKIAVIR